MTMPSDEDAALFAARCHRRRVHTRASRTGANEEDGAQDSASYLFVARRLRHALNARYEVKNTPMMNSENKC